MAPSPSIGGVGFRSNQKPFFWIGTRERPAQSGVHVAFAAGSREIVDEFHAAAMGAGATANGGPGLLRTRNAPEFVRGAACAPPGRVNVRTGTVMPDSSTGSSPA